MGRPKHELGILYVFHAYMAKERAGGGCRIQFQRRITEPPSSDGWSKREAISPSGRRPGVRYRASAPRGHPGTVASSGLFLCHSTQQDGSRGKAEGMAQPLPFRV